MHPPGPLSAPKPAAATVAGSATERPINAAPAAIIHARRRESLLELMGTRPLLLALRDRRALVTFCTVEGNT
jgi:hypothetical protein